MKELFGSVTSFYRDYRGTGKLPVLFLVSMLLLLLIAQRKEKTALEASREERSEKKETPSGSFSTHRALPPVFFLLSVWTGISYALTCLASENPAADASPEEKPHTAGRFVSRLLLSTAVIGLIAASVILSGGRVISEDYFSPAENTLHIKTEYIMIMDRLLELSEDESVTTVIAWPSISPYFKLYSSKFTTLYDHTENRDPASLQGSARIVYDQFSVSVPDMKRITDVGHKEGYDFLIVDTGRYYPEFKASEFGYELLDTILDVEIYRRRDL
ncbi:MAG TPA: hypothetical protein DCL38_10040 [Lachnospiraceae bacterium]|nr:hypothetical protein [Lachnospiraceae bacterium]